jgi:hypothetical protein
MPCCVGVTTEPQNGKAKWKPVYQNFRGWRLIAGPFNDRDEAEQALRKWAEEMRCVQHEREERPAPGAEWWVYHFKHDGKV